MKDDFMEKKEQLIHLISGDLASGEKEKLLEEIKKDPQLRKEYETIKNTLALASSDQQMDDVRVESSYLSFKKKNRTQGKTLLLNLLKYAAIVILVFTLGVFSRQIFTADPEKSPLNMTAYNEIHVPNGEKAELKLSDGSKVWLNSGTTIRFPKTFDERSRRVNLTGEAFFEIEKGAIPFIVSSNFGDIEVLGTSFNVRAYDDLAFQTTLHEGKIHFSNPYGEKLLGPGQQLILADQRNWIVKRVDPRFASSWKEGVISFEQEELGDVAKKLERHFNIQIILDPQIASIHFTGQVFNESVIEVMEYINKTKPINYTYDKKTRILKIKYKE
jgi:ferric-dicitrate binding protein FerR (iron transport regulator)